MFRASLVVTSAFARVELVHETSRTESFSEQTRFRKKPERVFGKAGTRLRNLSKLQDVLKLLMHP